MDAAVYASHCFHCGSALPASGRFTLLLDGIPRALCCRGCEAAARLILAQGLGRYYEFRELPARPASETAQDWSAYDREAALRRYTHLRSDGERELSVQLEGLHCAACAWLIENSLGRTAGVTQIQVNLGTARAELRYDPRRSTLSQLLTRLQALGFAPLPLCFSGGRAAESTERRTALKRLGVAGLAMMQVTTYAVSLYAGLMQGIAPRLEQFLRFVSLLVATPVVLYSAQPFFSSAWQSVRARRPGMDLPVALSIGAAYLWSVVATVRGQGAVYYDSVVMFTFFLLLGRYVEMSLRHRCGLQHDALARLLPRSVLRVCGERTERLTPDELRPGDRVRVLPGERVPADGRIETGSTEVDESLLTGESSAQPRRRGDTLVAGAINLSDVIELVVTRVGQDSTLAEVSRLLARGQAARPRSAELADRVAVWFVSGVLLLAALVALYWLRTDATRAFPTVLAVLVVTCPCALSLATPAALAAATARLGRAGVLVTRARALERLARADRVLFDKTGTVTRGEPRLGSISLLAARASQSHCLALAAALERYSNHPLARAFAELTPAVGLRSVRSVAGCGLEARLGDSHYRIGRLEYVLEACADKGHPPLEALQASVVLGDQRGLLAAFHITDPLRHEARQTIEQLSAAGLRCELASGDRAAAVAQTAHALGNIEARANLTAEQKLSRVQALQAEGVCVLMVGDGVNDAPVLAAADVSAAIGSGADIAKVSADLVLLGGLGGLLTALETSRALLRVVRQNLAWALLYNLAAVPLAACGWIQPWMAALGMSSSSVLVVMNAMRLRHAAAPAPQPQPLARAVAS